MAKNRREKYYSLANAVKFRAVETEPSEEDLMKFEGYAIVFNQPTVLYKDDEGNEYKEIIDSNSLANAEMKDVPLRYNHSTSWILARTRKKVGPGSLKLVIDDYGLKVSGEFVDTQYSRDVYAMMKAEVLDEMSFAFTARDYTYDSSTRTTTITDIDKLFDVSAVDNAAYPQASISAMRSAEQAELESKAKAEKEALEKANLAAEKRAQEAEAKRIAKVQEVLKRLKVEEVISRLS